LLDAQAALDALTAIGPVIQMVTDSQVVAPSAHVILRGIVRPSDGHPIVSYQWRAAASNPSNVSLLDADKADASFVAPAMGRYVFTLEAIDSTGAVATASASVRINNLPVTEAAATQQLGWGDRLQLQLRATDADGDALVFYALALPEGASLSATGLFNWSSASPVGSYTIRWYASDPYGGSAPGELTITVSDAVATPTTRSAGGGGGSMEGDVIVWGLALLAVGRRLHKRR
jgi:hypothetical protein